LHEDATILSSRPAALVMAVLNCTILALLDQSGIPNVRSAMRRFAAYPTEALALILGQTRLLRSPGVAQNCTSPPSPSPCGEGEVCATNLKCTSRVQKCTSPQTKRAAVCRPPPCTHCQTETVYWKPLTGGS
jgi:hypothetical protein